MSTDDDMDEVAFQTLWAEGCDPATAWEASRRDPPESTNTAARIIALVCAMAVAAVLMYLLS